MTPKTVPYLSRSDGGKEYYYPLGFAGSGEIVQFQVIRSVYKTLKLDPAVFGLTLG